MNPKLSKPLKFFILSAKGWNTGSALRTYYIAKALQKRGHQVSFIKPLPTLPFWIDMALSSFYYFFHSLRHRSDVALAVKPYPMVIPALWWQRVRGAKIVIDVDDLDFAYSHGKFRKTHESLQKPWPKWADVVTHHNDNLREHLLGTFEVPKEKIVQVPQGVDTELFSPGKADLASLPHTAKALYADKKKRPILTFTAHLNVACDLEPALFAHQALLKEVPTAQLLIAGGGPDEGRFKRIAEELGIAGSTHFTGMLTARQVAACLKISDAILVYYNELMVNEHRASMKLREAVACGGKIVATDVGEIRQWRGHVTLSKADPIRFAKAVAKALKSSKCAKPSAAQVRGWDWTSCVAELERKLLKT
jgi:glycosyltransferase involved in cell wall biosynthesis